MPRAARLTRFSETSELSRLNADPRLTVPVGPTLGTVLAWGIVAGRRTGGVVDVTLLDQRLAAETGRAAVPPEPRERWSLERRRNAFEIRRSQRVRFDLDGVAKGWIADRALELLVDWPAASLTPMATLPCRWARRRAGTIAIENPLDRRS